MNLLILTEASKSSMNGSDNVTVEDQIDNNRGIISCWSCKGPVLSFVTFCDTCGVIQPPGQSDHFFRLGLQPTFDVDKEKLDQQYFHLQRQLHPDRFVSRSPQERSFSQQQATAINDAYESLREPLSRADYLIDLLSNDDNPDGRARVNDQELLIESMEMREALMGADTLEQIDSLLDRAQNDIKLCIETLSKSFSNNDIDNACKHTMRLKYLKKLTDETRIKKVKFI